MPEETTRPFDSVAFAAGDFVMQLDGMPAVVEIWLVQVARLAGEHVDLTYRWKENGQAETLPIHDPLKRRLVAEAAADLQEGLEHMGGSVRLAPVARG